HQRLVDRGHSPVHGRVDVRDALGGLHLGERLAGRDRGAHVGQLHVHDVAQGVLGVVGDANPHAGPVSGTHPLVLGGVTQVVRDHESSSPRTLGTPRWAPRNLSLTSTYEVGRAYSGGSSRRNAETVTLSRSSTVTVPPSL